MGQASAELRAAAARRLALSMYAASDSRAIGAWNPLAGDADAVTLDQLPVVRARARDAALQNPVAKALRKVFADHVVSHGIEFLCEVDADRIGFTEQQAQDWQGEVNALFQRIIPHADSAGRCDFYRLQRLALLSMIDGGDVFVAYTAKRGTESPVNARINLIEAERVDTPPGKHGDPNVVGGVETDADGMHVAYHVQRGHPGSNRVFDFTFERLPLRSRTPSGDVRPNIHQIVEIDRIGQSRGIPWLTPALPVIDQVPGYVDEVLLAARIQNAVNTWLETADPEASVDAMSTDFDANGIPIGDLGVGVRFAPPGTTAKLLSTTVPGQYFDPLIVRLLRIIGAAVGVPYEIFSGDLQGANFSSMRHQWQTLKKTIRCLQDLLAVAFEKYWRLAIYQAWLDGKLGAIGQRARVDDNPDEWLRCRWQYPAMGYIDPSVEVSANREEVEAGFKSPQEVIRERGGDPVTVIAERREWAAMNAPAPDESPAPADAADSNRDVQGGSEDPSGSVTDEGEAEEQEQDASEPEEVEA